MNIADAEAKRLRELKIPDELNGKKLVMSSEMFVHEFEEILYNFVSTIEREPNFLKLNEEGMRLIIKQYTIGYLELLWKQNIDSKPDDQEDIQ